MISRVTLANFLVAACGLVFVLEKASASDTLYDNLDLPYDLNAPGGVIGPRPDAGDRFFAQHFLTDGRSTITSATILMQRIGTSAGPLHVDIWSDGSGAPGAPIGRLASVDIATVPTDPAGTAVLFEGALDLQPHSPYYLVVDNIDMNIANLDNTFRLGMRNSNEGTNGAGRAQVTNTNTTDEWLILGDLLPRSNYLQMQVNAVPEPTGLVLLTIAIAGAIVLQRFMRCSDR